ncbi:unnamed protein product [Hymenolepis diminuta]|uniref:Dynein, axonemal, light intermediate chain 1 n=1 Tax=Hymenolepis diminuta TaxID=6216 RepID=A0A0R3SGH7_HYMDI|nr:unnamed protein product [Hymenolepis diminuta]
MIPPNVSLVKYDVPVLITKKQDNKNPNCPTIKGIPKGINNTGPVPTSGLKPCIIKPCDEKHSQAVEEILNSIIPPSTPATRLDVVNLQEELDRRLQQRQARETGICPVRRELYSQVFDELIRQVTINCAERGLLLLRVRDEIRMTIAAYQTLYESSVAFGMRKALQSEQGKADLETKILEMEAFKKSLDRQVNELKEKCEQIEKHAAEQRQVEEKKHQDEIQFLKLNNQQLKVSHLVTFL